MRCLWVYVPVLLAVLYVAACGANQVTSSGGDPEPVPVKVRFLNKTLSPATIAANGIGRRIKYVDSKGGAEKSWDLKNSPTSSQVMTKFDPDNATPTKRRPDQNGDTIKGGHSAHARYTWKSIDLEPVTKADVPKNPPARSMRTDQLSVTVTVDGVTLTSTMEYATPGTEDFKGEIICLLTQEDRSSQLWYVLELFAEHDDGTSAGWGYVKTEMQK